MLLKTRFLYFCILVFVLSIVQTNAQILDTYVRKQIDSLKAEFNTAKHDTNKIRLNYHIGVKAKIQRLSYWNSILKDTRRYNLLVFEIKILKEIGMVYLAQSKKSQAAECFNKGLLVAEKKGFRQEALLLINNLLLTYSYASNQPEKERILNLYYKGLKIAEELNDKRTMIDFYSSIATCYFLASDIFKALKMHKECLKISKELNYTYGIADALSSIGSNYHALKDDKKAIAYYLESGKYADEFKGTIYEAEFHIYTSAAYEFMGEPDSTIKYCKKVLAICKKMNEKSCTVSALVVLAKAYYRLDDIKQAENIALEALALTKAINFSDQIPDLALLIKKIYLRKKNYKEALKAYELHITVRDSISNEKIRKQALEKEFSYNLEKKESENKLLARQNQIQNLRLSQNTYLLFGIAGIAILILSIAYLIARQNKFKNQHQKMHMEQKLISSQMNPHFVFNSLNAIQHLIMNKENEKAEYYLSKFSKLIRELLESNTKESLTVREEVAILTGYLEMEAKRFSKSFHYTIQVDEKINQETTNIPHMMIQPFVENAIWHGLLPKVGERNLSILYEFDTDKTIRCTVEDNGVGREAAMKKENTFKKKSLALSFVKQRLDLMQETLKVKCEVKIIDKKNELGGSLGTKIIIVLPLL